MRISTDEKERLMADIRPFPCIRPSREKAASVAALPYDVYSRSEAKLKAAENPDSFLNIDRPETQFADDADMYSEQVYQKAHDLLWERVADGSFIRDEKRCYYVYELTMDGRTQTGITACASIDDYENQVIKKHENTRADKEADRIRHVDSCNAQTGPIFLAYRSNETVERIVTEAKKQEPTASATVFLPFVKMTAFRRCRMRLPQLGRFILQTGITVRRLLSRQDSDAGSCIRAIRERKNLIISCPCCSRMTSF